MLKFVVVLSFVACALAGTIPEGMVSLNDNLGGRIVGGTPTTITSFPWQVSIQRSGSHTCGGTVYNNRIIVTAAHCLQSVSAAVLRIRAGSSYWNSGGVVISVATFLNHEYYNSVTELNDVAVIKLAASLTFSSNIQPIGLATSTPRNGASASVSGWGTQKFGVKTHPSQLHYINVSIIDPTKCASNTYSYGSAIKPGMVCAADSGKDSCQGDSGGPLVSGGVLVGVVSWGNGCGLAKYPGVYADVANYRRWIVNTANSI